MSEILLYAISMMYSPGPVNLLSLNQGIQKQTKTSLGFFAGVGCSMFIFLVIGGYAGASLIRPDWLFFISVPGCLYIMYLALKIFRASTRLSQQAAQSLRFIDGLMMQSLNPKGFISVIPITTIQLPAAGISGWHILLWSAGLSVLAFGAPFSYAISGSLLGRGIKRPELFKIFNQLLATILIFVAVKLGYSQAVLFLGE